MAKRKLDSAATETSPARSKRVRLQTGVRSVSNASTSSTASAPAPTTPGMNVNSQTTEHEAPQGKGKRKQTDDSNTNPQGKGKALSSQHKVRKLVPPRPFPSVPASVSATGPRSAHSEGKNYICITRRTELGAYLRRCKDVFIKDGCVVVSSRTTGILTRSIV